jgi:pheromone shutdown protein TraB
VQDSDVLTAAMKEFGSEFPELMRPLIAERDEYMVFMLRLLASRYAAPHGYCTLVFAPLFAMHAKRCARPLHAPCSAAHGNAAAPCLNQYISFRWP